MWWSRSVMCAVCQVPVPKPRAKRTLERRTAYVCYTCYERWNRSGRICGKCETPVHEGQPTALFAPEQTLGHALCGGVFLAA